MLLIVKLTCTEPPPVQGTKGFTRVVSFNPLNDSMVSTDHA